MLQSIRDRTQGWIAGIIISLLILSFALWGIHSYLVGGGSVNNVVAKVNGVEITQGQLTNTYDRLRRQLQTQNEASLHTESFIKEQALQSLINLQVVKQASVVEHYVITPRQVDNYLMEMPEFQVDGQFSLARFQQILNATLYSANEFLDFIRTFLLINQPRLGVIFTSFTLPNETNASIALVNQKRDVQFVLIPLQTNLKETINIPQDKITGYYQQHQSEFKTPEQVSLEYIELSLKDIKNTIYPSDEELKKFYSENINSFVKPAYWQVESILVPLAANATEQEIKQGQQKIDEIFKKAQAGKDFTALLQEYSLEKDSRIPKWVTINQVPFELQNSLTNLTKAGELTNPAKTSKGFLLLKVVSYQEAEAQPLATIEDKVKEALIKQKAEEKFAAKREKLVNVTYEHPDSLTPAAKELGLAIQTSEFFTKDKGGKDISANNKVREAAFSNDVLNLKNNSDIIQPTADTAIIIRVKSHAPASLLPLATVQSQIVDKLKTEAIDAKTLQLVNDIKTKLQTGANPDQIAQQFNLSWNKVSLIERHSNKINSAILDTAFSMPKPDLHDKITFDIAKVPNGYAIVGLTAVQDGNLQNTDEYRVFAEQIQNTQGLLEYELYKQSLIKHAKIKVTPAS